MRRLSCLLLIVCLFTAVMYRGVTTAGAEETMHTITFDMRGIGEQLEPIQIKDGEKYIYLGSEDNPKAEGYVFHCWVTTLDFEPDEVAMSNTAAYLETPIHEDMTLYAIWYKIIDRVDVTVDAPKAGELIGKDRYETEDFSFEYQSPRPHAEVTSEGARVQDNFWSVIGPSTFWLSDPNDAESFFYGTFEHGKEYGVSVDTEPIFGYQFADQLTVTFNGKTLSEPFYADYNLCTVIAPILCGEPTPVEPETSHVVEKPAEKADPATSDQKTASNSSASNPHAIQTGSSLWILLISLMTLSLAVVILLRRKSKN